MTSNKLNVSFYLMKMGLRKYIYIVSIHRLFQIFHKAFMLEITGQEFLALLCKVKNMPQKCFQKM